MPDVILGGQQIAVDDPSKIMGMLDNLLKIQMASKLREKQEEEKQSLLQTLQGYNLSPAEEGPPKSFEEAGQRYRGAVSGGEGKSPELQFSKGEGKPQVTNLRQLVDVIQGLKGLPPEYASAIVGRLTGIADPSEVQNEKLLRLRASLSDPYKEEALRLKEEKQKATEKAGEEKITQQREMMLKRLKATALSNIIKSSINPKERQSATEELMKLLVGEESSVAGGGTPNFTVKWKVKE